MHRILLPEIRNNEVRTVCPLYNIFCFEGGRTRDAETDFLVEGHLIKSLPSYLVISGEGGIFMLFFASKNIIEKFLFRSNVAFHRTMIIQVIMSNIRQYSEIKFHSLKSILIEPMRRGFQDGNLAATILRHR